MLKYPSSDPGYEVFAGEIPKDIATSVMAWLKFSVRISILTSVSGAMVSGTAKPTMRALARETRVARKAVVRMLSILWSERRGMLSCMQRPERC